jgi:hypothetical protein
MGRPLGSPNIPRAVPMDKEEVDRIKRMRDLLEPHVADAVKTLKLCMSDECTRWATRERAASKVLEFYNTTIGLKNAQENEPAQIIVVKSDDIAEAATRAADLYQKRIEAKKRQEVDEGN